jgi:hypothetical protein
LLMLLALSLVEMPVRPYVPPRGREVDRAARFSAA